MELGDAGLKEQPFRIHGRPLTCVSYVAQREALDFLADVYNHPRGLGVFTGPSLSGKTTIIRDFVDSLDADAEVAVVNASGLNSTAMLESVLAQYGYLPDLNGINELLGMLKVILMQRTASARAPLLVIENTHAMSPRALGILCDLAELKVRHQSAIRLVLSSDREITSLIEAHITPSVAGRINFECRLGPMSQSETADYLYTKLQAGGCSNPNGVIPAPVCDDFYYASGGWPGIIDRLVLLALAKATHCPLEASHVEHPRLPEQYPPPPPVRKVEDDPVVSAGARPRLLLTKDGETLRELVVERDRVIIGRSDLNDLQIDSRFVSRHHALLVRSGNATILMDLNSTNGTYVNSVRVSSQLLMDDDIITIGSHGIKFKHAAAARRGDEAGPDFTETVIMKSMDDMRRTLAQENTMAMPAPDLRAAAGGDGED